MYSSKRYQGFKQNKLKGDGSVTIFTGKGAKKIWEGIGYCLKEIPFEEYQEILVTNLNDLSENHKLIFSLRYEHGLEIREVAKNLGCTHQNVGLILRKETKQINILTGLFYRELNTPLLEKSIYHLKMGTSLTNLLLRKGMDTIGKLASTTREDLSKLRGLGDKGIMAIKDRLEDIGIKVEF